MNPDSIAPLEKLLADGKDSPMLRYGLGSAYLKLDQHDKAAEHFGKAVEMDPSYSAAWKLLGKALTSGGLRPEAMRAYQTGIDAAQANGDKQAAKEMRVFLRRLEKGS